MKYKVTLNGKVYEVVVEEGEAVLEAEYEAASAAPAAAAPESPRPASNTQEPSGKGEIIGAPFPGSVIKICKKAGDSVKKGEPMVIIEAMKMENEISAPHDGKISAIYVNGGQSVEKGTPLVSLS